MCLAKSKWIILSQLILINKNYPEKPTFVFLLIYLYLSSSFMFSNLIKYLQKYNN